MRVTIKQLQDTIKAKDLLIQDYVAWFDVLQKHREIKNKSIDRKNETIQRQAARIKVLGKALAALERDYEALKRKKK